MFWLCKGQQCTCARPHTTHTLTFMPLWGHSPTQECYGYALWLKCLTLTSDSTPKQTFVVVGTKCSDFIKISSLQMNRVFWSSLCRMHKNTNAHAASAVVWCCSLSVTETLFMKSIKMSWFEKHFQFDGCHRHRRAKLTKPCCWNLLIRHRDGQNGCRPSIKARLRFGFPPESFLKLAKLCLTSYNIKKSFNKC